MHDRPKLDFIFIILMVLAVGRKSRAAKVNSPLCYVTQPCRNTGTVEEQYILVLFAYRP